MEIVIRIKTDNAAFDADNGGPEAEVGRILHAVADAAEKNVETLRGRRLRDINGNTVGSVEVLD